MLESGREMRTERKRRSGPPAGSRASTAPGGRRQGIAPGSVLAGGCSSFV